MFVISVLEDEIALSPEQLGEDIQLALKHAIQDKYLDRVIPKIGLVVAFYDFAQMEGKNPVKGSVPINRIYPDNLPLGLIHAGDLKTSFGESHFRVVFRLVVFKPQIGEWLAGSLLSSDKDGIRVDLGFFQDVFIPKSNLMAPFALCKERQLYLWAYSPPGGKAEGEAQNYVYELHQPCRFRVTEVNFPEAQEPPAPAQAETATILPAPLSQRASPMIVIGAMDQDGLGLMSWWPENAPPPRPLAGKPEDKSNKPDPSEMASASQGPSSTEPSQTGVGGETKQEAGEGSEVKQASGSKAKKTQKRRRGTDEVPPTRIGKHKVS